MVISRYLFVLYCTYLLVYRTLNILLKYLPTISIISTNVTIIAYLPIDVSTLQLQYFSLVIRVVSFVTLRLILLSLVIIIIHLFTMIAPLIMTQMCTFVIYFRRQLFYRNKTTLNRFIKSFKLQHVDNASFICNIFSYP